MKSYVLYVPGLPGPAYTMHSAGLPAVPSVGDYLTVPEWARGQQSPACVRVTHVPTDLDMGIECTDRMV